MLSLTSLDDAELSPASHGLDAERASLSASLSRVIDVRSGTADELPVLRNPSRHDDGSSTDDSARLDNGRGA